MFMMGRTLFTVLAVSALLLPAITHAEEGMYPVSEIHRPNLSSAGLEITPREIYNPEGISMIDAIVRVGGCSGSFVSPSGLILTNHHCVFKALRAASSPESDYLRNGFLARDKTEEIPAPGFTVRITESYRDVSEEILSAVRDVRDDAARSRAITHKKKELIKEAEAQNPGKRAEVAEMFIGKTYILFLYTYLKDVRLVYAPPRAIGEFGGEIDNWEWPRHTGDFSFMRVYTAPNGSPADYSPDNVPYQPRRYLQVAAEGVDENDFVFILGYPGKTYRQRTSHFVAYDKDINLPYIVDLYDWQISLLESMSRGHPDIALKHASRIKSLSNVLKRSRGKLAGLKAAGIVETKRTEEEALQAFIETNERQAKRYGEVLAEIGKVYQEIRRQALYELNLEYLKKSCYLLNFAFTLYEWTIERQKEDVERESPYMDRNIDQTIQKMLLAAEDYHEPTDRLILKEMLGRISALPRGREIPALEKVFKENNIEAAIEAFIDRLYRNSQLSDEQVMRETLEKSAAEIEAIGDPFIEWAKALYPTYRELREEERRREGRLSTLHAKLIEVKKQFLKSDFIPDANGTLRLTYGHIRGYSPADAVYMFPITTLRGVVEKSTTMKPFDTPPGIIELYRAREFGPFEHPELKDVPVCILYNTDTTGGNSGSAVFNARGQIVGINFDRVYQATINDYAWSERYSRSIGVDIRYVLWVTQKIAGADYLLREMNILPKW